MRRPTRKQQQQHKGQPRDGYGWVGRRQAAVCIKSSRGRLKKSTRAPAPPSPSLCKPDWAAALLLSVTVAGQIFIFIPLCPLCPPPPPPPPAHLFIFHIFMIFIFGAGILFAPAAQICALRILLRVGFRMPMDSDGCGSLGFELEKEKVKLQVLFLVGLLVVLLLLPSAL